MQRKINHTTIILILTTMMSLCCGISCRAQLPQVNIIGNFSREYSAGQMTISDSDGQQQTYTIKARYHGHSTLKYTKKSFSVKIIDDKSEKENASLLGMRNDNSWILDAMVIDKARMRNRVSFDLWRDFASDSYIKRVYGKNSVNSIAGKYVELSINGTYHGLYLLTEKIDRKQLKLKKYDDDGIHGLLYKAEGYYGTAFWDASDFDNTLSKWNDWESSYPDVDDYGATDYAPLADAIDFTLNSSDSVFAAEAAERFDLPVWMDHLLLINLIYGKDNYAKNTYLWIYDKDQTTMIGISPWDMDGTWGRMTNGSMSATDATINFHNVTVRLMNCYPNFKQKLAARYFDLRKSWFDADSLKNRFYSYQQLFETENAYSRDSCRWDGVNSISLNLKEEIDYICQWIDKRLSFLDDYFLGLSAITSPNAVSSSTSFPTYNAMGIRVDPTSLRKGLYIRNGRKFVVK